MSEITRSGGRPSYEELLNEVAPHSGSWSEAVKVIVERFKIGAKFNQDVVYNPVGSDALGKLIESMARILDTEVMLRKDSNAD